MERLLFVFIAVFAASPSLAVDLSGSWAEYDANEARTESGASLNQKCLDPKWEIDRLGTATRRDGAAYQIFTSDDSVVLRPKSTEFKTITYTLVDYRLSPNGEAEAVLYNADSGLFDFSNMGYIWRKCLGVNGNNAAPAPIR